jgi:hypothetical protein
MADMLSIGSLLQLLGYEQSAHFRTKESDFEPETAQHFRLAKDGNERGIEVLGFYVYEAAPEADQLPAKVAVCVAEANSTEKARGLHKRIWNLGNVPFLIVRLPNEIRVYSGFSYQEKGDAGLLATQTYSDERKLLSALKDFTSASIDSAEIWKTRASELQTRDRVNERLLANLQELAVALSTHCSPKLNIEIAHALIGKFVYLRYLRDRNILDDSWLTNRKININRVFGTGATLEDLMKLDEALETRFNGKVFHIDFEAANELGDAHVQLVASVLAGSDVVNTQHGFVEQLHFAFKAYDFRHIPVETLSSIYEQFLHAQKKGRSEGAYYTPEVVADYLLSEVNSIRELKPGMTILDPACGSGIFLVLAYRRLIELELAATGKRPGEIDPTRLRQILTESIYGVERQPDACNVTVFSLILTLLHYVTPPELHANHRFKFPALLNSNIFCSDFFDPKLKMRHSPDGFDVVLGNPPWIELKPNTEGEEHARSYLASEPSSVGNRVAEAFAVKAGRLLKRCGVGGLLLPSTTLFNLEGKRFRQKFFAEFQVHRITNFANLRSNLFAGRVSLPAATFVFRNVERIDSASPVLHYGPYAVDQVAGFASDLWTLTIHGSEIQTVPQRVAATGETSVWKLALWGTERDARAIQELRKTFPLTLGEYCREKGWGSRLPREGAQLRQVHKVEAGIPKSSNDDELIHCPELKGQKRCVMDQFNKSSFGQLQFSLPSDALQDISDDWCYIRKRGGQGGLTVNKPPHLLIPAAWKNFLLFSEEYFAVPARQMAITCKPKDSENLRALAMYLASSLVDYFVFFHVPEWGVYSTMPIVVQKVIRDIPVPNFTGDQVRQLGALHREMIGQESQSGCHPHRTQRPARNTSTT